MAALIGAMIFGISTCVDRNKDFTIAPAVNRKG
jgi:hypothetical protein